MKLCGEKSLGNAPSLNKKTHSQISHEPNEEVCSDIQYVS